MAYCNVTTDLTDVFPDIERYQEKFILEDWYATSGQNSTYEVRGCGQVNMVFDDGEMLTEKTSIATVEGTAGTWWYDSDNDIVYVHAKGSDDLTSASITIEGGEDWDTLKDNMRDKAMQFMDSVLNPRYPTPLMPRQIKTHDTADYEYPILRCCALLTCAFIAKRRNPKDANGERLLKEAWNPEPEPGEQKGWLNQLRDGDMVLQDQISAREVGGFNIYPKSDNTSTAYAWFLGTYSGLQYERWRLQIDTEGAIGTATWKLSKDGGTTWGLETQDTFDTTDPERRIYISDGIYCIFYGTFGEGDYWDVEVFPLSDSPDVQKMGSAETWR